MSEIPTASAKASVHTSDAAAKRLKARAAANWRLRIYGLCAIAFAVLALVVLLWSVFERAWQSTKEHYAAIEFSVPRDVVDPENVRGADYAGLLKGELRSAFPSVSGRMGKKQLYGLISDGAADDLRDEAKAGNLVFDTPIRRELLLSDDASLYLGGHFGDPVTVKGQGALTLELEGKTVALASASSDFSAAVGAVKFRLRDEAQRLRENAARQEAGMNVLTDRLATADESEADSLRAQIESFAAKRDQLLTEADAIDEKILAASTAPLTLTPVMPSFFVRAKGGILKLTSVSSSGAEAQILVPPSEYGDVEPQNWSLMRMDEPEAGRTVSDLQLGVLEDMRTKGRIVEKANWRFLSKGDSREAELAGIKGAVVGSLWTMLVTFLIAFPTGVLAAIYLEEFAPKNRLTDFIEVNINNLAAVPSIVFGLLGVALFIPLVNAISDFDARSTPLIGGMVLAIMTLPTVVIASRAAIRAVPPSIRDAAMGLGASRVQTVFHHVLPLAMPGILTGAIIGMAQALGETAPLLLIGMVAFITAVPEGVLDSATVLPVQVFIWANQSEQAFDFRTAAAIVVLLGFLIVMNLLAILLRKKFERRW